MKRKYLFRGKTIHDNKWIYGQVHNYGDGIFICEDKLQNNNGDEWKVKGQEVLSESIGQCTEVTVKDDVILFEGDIVNGAEFNGSYAYGYVVYHHGAFVVAPIGRFLEGLRDLCYSTKQLTVIGNVTDNPELFDIQTKG